MMLNVLITLVNVLASLLNDAKRVGYPVEWCRFKFSFVLFSEKATTTKSFRSLFKQTFC